jgi:hypothetical protein
MSIIKLRGSRVLLNCPPRKDLGLHLSEEAQKDLLIKQLEEMTALDVFAVGDAVTDIKVGDKVYITPSTIMHDLVDVEESKKFLIREMDVVFIW